MLAIFCLLAFLRIDSIFCCRWEHGDESYCADVQKVSLYGSGRLLLDIIDACVFDYIVGNADRHHFEMFLNETDSILIMFDNGKRLTSEHLGCKFENISNV